MGRRSRRRARSQEPLPESPVESYDGPGGQRLALRTVMTPKTRELYARTFAGNPLSQEDAWQRAVEFLFERLAVEWEINGVETEGQAELLARFRVASPEERRFVRESLRTHCAEWFPELQAP